MGMVGGLVVILVAHPTSTMATPSSFASSLHERPRGMSAKRTKTKPGERQLRSEIEALAAVPDNEIDTSDIAERRDWSKAEIGKFYRPTKQQVTLRIDADVLAWFKAQGGKYQSALNAALRDYVERRKRG